MRQALVFDVGGRRIGLWGELLREVLRAVAISPLPASPPIIEGIIDLRGSVVPVLDIRHRLGLEPAELSPEQHLLIVEVGNRVAAVRVDRALDLIEVDASAIESEPFLGLGGDALVAGIVKLSDGLLVITDLERFLSLDEALGLDAALATQAAS